MYRCERCGGTFAAFKIPGQCPLCGTWASVRCGNCAHIDAATVFINNGNRCPKCNAVVALPGEAPAQRRLSGKDVVTGVGCLLLLTACWFPFTLGEEIHNGHWWAVIVEVAAAAGAIAALRWGLKGRTKQ